MFSWGCHMTEYITNSLDVMEAIGFDLSKVAERTMSLAIVAKYCGNGESWFGWDPAMAVGQATLIFTADEYGRNRGNFEITLSNCWNSGAVRVYYNNILIGSAQKQNVDVRIFMILFV